MDEEQRREIAEKLEKMAVPMDRREFTPEQYNKLFPFGKVNTPIGAVRLGEHQFQKLKERHREKLLGAMKQTLEDPIVILKEERNGKYARIYIKSFLGKAKTEPANVISVVVDIEGIPTAISTSERRKEQIETKIKTAGSPLYTRGGDSPTHGTGG